MGRQTKYQITGEFVFRPRGLGRFLEAAFLCMWLCMWVVGEAFALFILGQGGWALLTGTPAAGSNEPIRMVPALGAGAFLLV
jgi:hypothetical protein